MIFFCGSVYNNPIIIIVTALLRKEWYFSVDLFILANKFKKRRLFFLSITISRGTPSDISRNPGFISMLGTLSLVRDVTHRLHLTMRMVCSVSWGRGEGMYSSEPVRSARMFARVRAVTPLFFGL
jgi:hypothetical protein